MPVLKKLFVLILLLCLSGIGLLSVHRADADDFLSPEKAFQFSARMTDPQTVEVNYRIADGYYLYRSSLQFKAADAVLGTPVIPSGQVHYDDNFQKEVETYRHALRITIPVSTDHPFLLSVTSQGCAEKGVCYPPIQSEVTLSPAVLSQQDVNSADDWHSTSAEDALLHQSTWWMMALFFILGIGLSVTPCVLPMVPILSSIIVGDQKSQQKSRGLLLSLCYVLGMALIYTLTGIAAGIMGEGLAGWLQQPWVLILFALLMAALALSLLNVYQFQMPLGVQEKLTTWTNQMGGGKWFSTFVMGAISALIVGPCVAAPLAGILLYISQTQDALRGGIALFSLAIGMGMPLLAIGAFSRAILPRLGQWMEQVKRLFAVLMLATALWMIQPLISAQVLIAGWSLLAVLYGTYLVWHKTVHWLLKAVGVLALVWGVVQFANVIVGGDDVWHPFRQFTGHASTDVSAGPHFVRIHNEAELDAALRHNPSSYAMLDFYADWCVSCIEMERFTFPDTQVKAKLDQMLLLQIDVTANNADDRAMLKRFNLYGPPGIIFFNKQGQEVPHSRVIGFQDVPAFLKSLAKLP